MRRAGKVQKLASAARKQVNVRVEAPLYSALETVARRERRSVAQTAKQLMEDGLRHRLGATTAPDDLPDAEIAALAQAGGAFDWLGNEPDLYDEEAGEPL